ncbi:uncharacterized protein OCT59_025161 [Rhizophagus irregularis]|uniref:uncharacterized protein n=1 Tax=Rhizophagus irregularis TaxID=588596 RepID=UPI00332BACC0|nr:hypothetical protein OCT59_025161 [Rhizophagus irregularis]
MDGFPAIYRIKGYFTSEIEVKWGLLSFKTKPHVIVGSSIWISLGAKDIKRQHIIICLDKGIVKVGKLPSPPSQRKKPNRYGAKKGRIPRS